MKKLFSFLRKRPVIYTLFASVYIISCTQVKTEQKDEYIAGDFHQHTTYSGGDYSIGHVMEASYKYGLDWWANSDHGGTREFWGMASGDDLGTRVTWKNAGIKILGDSGEKGKEGYMWRWQSLKYYNFKDILFWRRVFTDKLILQAFEWNVPGHEHANVSIITNQFDAAKQNCDPLAQFEYMFDDDDKDTTGGKMFEWRKSALEGKEKAIEAVKWLQSNYGKQAYVIPSHPDKSGKYSIADFRDLNNAAPDVCFGFDGMPGHQKNRIRGGYDLEDALGIGELNNKQGATYGGAGIYMSKIGGLWDALLSEGRHWWISASSDFHSDDDFFPGEFQKTYTRVTRKNDPQALIDGMRSGNTFVVTGGLITHLEFSVEEASMGQTLKTDKNTIMIKIRFFDPDSSNYNTYSDYTNPLLDHIDLIAGHYTGPVLPGSDGYNKDSVSTTSVIARFDGTGGLKDANGILSQKWEDSGDGWKTITYNAVADGKMYFRLRGTNLALNSKDELDAEGNPLPDISGENTAEKAFSDLWFYSNPVFVEYVSKSN